MHQDAAHYQPNNDTSRQPDYHFANHNNTNINNQHFPPRHLHACCVGEANNPGPEGPEEDYSDCPDLAEDDVEDKGYTSVVTCNIRGLTKKLADVMARQHRVTGLQECEVLEANAKNLQIQASEAGFTLTFGEPTGITKDGATRHGR